MKKNIISFVLIFQILMLSLGVGILSFDLSNKCSGVVASQTTATSPTDLVTEPKSLDELQRADDLQIEEWSNLEKFDGRKYGYVTPQKWQIGPICWAYATTGLAEVSILRQGLASGYDNTTLVFDDQQFAYASRNRQKSFDPLMLTNKDLDTETYVYNNSGALKKSCLTLSNGYSPVLASKTNGNPEQDIESDYIAEQVIGINNIKTEIKKAILKYGAVAFAYETGEGQPSYIYAKGVTDHASVIVGWDDNIDKSEFKYGTEQPKENGAWIVKNSWGEKSGADSVNEIYAYYVSYETSMHSLFAVDMAVKSEMDYNIYRYDGSPLDESGRLAEIEGTAAIFEAKMSDAKNQEYLDAVNIVFEANEVNLNIDIYKLKEVNPGNVNDKINNPEQDHVLHQEAVFKRGGAYTIKLDEEIPLNQGEYFSIVIKDKSGKDIGLVCAVDSNSTNDMTYYYKQERWYSYKFSESYLYADNPETLTYKAARIRAFTKTKVREVAVDDEKDIKFARIELDNRLFCYQKDVTHSPSVMVFMGSEQLKENKDYKVEIKGDKITPGTVDVTIKGVGEYSGERTTVFEIARPYRPELPTKEIMVYKGTNSLKDVSPPTGWKWLSEDTILNSERNNCTVIYVGDDANCYINTMDSVYVIKVDEEPPQQQNISVAQIEISGECTYTGNLITPNVTVTLNSKKLNKGIDYNVVFSNNINAGTATVTITGIGLYTGSATEQFEIKKASQPKNMPQTKLQVSRKVKKLSEIQDLLPDGWTWQTPSTPIADEAMTAIAVYKDTKNYETSQVSITISRADRINIETLKITILQSTKFVYNNGKQICPELEILDWDYLLRKNEDYTVDYQDNTNAGQGKIIVSGRGEYYQGTTTLYFTIQREERTDFKVTQSGWTYGDTSPSPSVTGEMEVAAITYTYSTSEIGTYNSTKPTNAGTYWIKAKIEASKNYNATESKARFVISPKDLSRFTTEIKDDNLIYTGQEIKPQIVVKDGQTNLKENTDFVATYSNNINAGNKASIKIQGENNYTGTINRTFKILKAAQPNNVPQTINVSKYAKKLGDIKLPTGWEWENPTLEITEDMTTARIVRIDGNNYVQSTFDIKLNFVDEPDQPTDETIDASVLWWGLGIIGGITIFGIVWWLISKRKKKWWEN